MLGDSLRRRHSATEPEPENGPRTEPDAGKATRRFGWRHWLLAALIMLGGSFLVGYLLSTQLLFPRPATAGTGVPVPELFGLDGAEAEERLTAAGLEIGDVTELVNADAEPGLVLAQDPLPGQQLRRGGAVAYAVSTGAAEVRIPPLAGLDALAAQDLLQQSGLEVDVQQTRTVGIRKGAVVGTEPGSGTVVQLPAAVTLVVSAGPPAVDSLGPPPDTLDPRLNRRGARPALPSDTPGRTGPPPEP